MPLNAFASTARFGAFGSGFGVYSDATPLTQAATIHRRRVRYEALRPLFP
jgi:hypothetical protein